MPIQGDQLYMAVVFWYPVKCDLSIVAYTGVTFYNTAMFIWSGCIGTVRCNWVYVFTYAWYWYIAPGSGSSEDGMHRGFKAWRSVQTLRPNQWIVIQFLTRLGQERRGEERRGEDAPVVWF